MFLWLHQMLHWTLLHMCTLFNTANCHKQQALKRDHRVHSAVHQEKLKKGEWIQRTKNGLQATCSVMGSRYCQSEAGLPSSGSTVFPHTCCLWNFKSKRERRLRTATGAKGKGEGLGHLGRGAQQEPLLPSEHKLYFLCPLSGQ